MHTMSVNNVNELWNRMCTLFSALKTEDESRNGKVWVLDGPVMIEVRNPDQRVLFDPDRNCNPTFHLIEALWMLAGRNDVEFLHQFNSNMATFSDDGKTFNAAYGHRWRNYFEMDQIEKAISMLAANPKDRRVVISMWDGYEDLGSQSLDLPCNLQIIPRVVGSRLDFTTTNRSNDMVWGLCGANAVHMSVLHEYMAIRLGLSVGHWHHFSNNLHVYERHFDLVRGVERNPHLSWMSYQKQSLLGRDDNDWFMGDIQKMLDGSDEGFQTPFMEDTVAPMLLAWRQYKAGDLAAAYEMARCIESWDWRKACTEWYKRIEEKRNATVNN